MSPPNPLARSRESESEGHLVSQGSSGLTFIFSALVKKIRPAITNIKVKFKTAKAFIYFPSIWHVDFLTQLSNKVTEK